MAAAAVRQYERVHRRPVPPLARRIVAELRPFLIAFVLLQYVLGALTQRPFTGWLMFATGAGLIVWHGSRNDDDDDRWKRRRNRVAERVARIHARLTIVPATGGQGHLP